MKIKVYNTATSVIKTYETDATTIGEFANEIRESFDDKKVVVRETRVRLENSRAEFPTEYDEITLFVGPDGKIKSGLSNDIDMSEFIESLRVKLNSIFDEIQTEIEDGILSTGNSSLKEEAEELGF